MKNWMRVYVVLGFWEIKGRVNAELVYAGHAIQEAEVDGAHFLSNHEGMKASLSIEIWKNGIAGYSQNNWNPIPTYTSH